MAKAPFRLEWDAHEYEHKERSSDWFWAMGIVAVSVAIASIIFGNVILAILIIIGFFSLTLFINREPDTVHVVIDENGITKGNIRYLYDSLNAFWVDDVHEHPKIILHSRKMFMPLIVVPIGDIDPEKLRRILSRYVPEQYMSLPLMEKFLEYLGF